MQFTTIQFAIFFTIVFVSYWFVLRKSIKAQNLLLLVSSYVFYAWWDWRFLCLIIFTTVTTFFTSKHAYGKMGKYLTALSVFINLAILLAFKYFGFFVENFRLMLMSFGFDVNKVMIEVVLPVGISFYTFQCIAYSIDVQKKRIKPCTQLLAFSTFVAYFPQLVAGPIERASQLLRQLMCQRKWDYEYAVTGLRMVLFGVMKKVCVADMLALYSDRAFENVSNPIVAVFAGVLFTLQIYFDFSAYSEIARGVSRMLGIELMANFCFPYFSRNVLEFWRRWHISLMLWFRDYVYIPMGGSLKGNCRTIFNVIVVFILSGLWHGAAWNFVAWGVFWAIIYVVGKMLIKLPKHNEPIRFAHLPQMVLTLSVVTFGFYICRCTDWQQISCGFKSIFHYAMFFCVCWLAAKLIVFVREHWLRLFNAMVSMCCIMAIALIICKWQSLLNLWWIAVALIVVAMEWKNRNCNYAVCEVSTRRWVRCMFYWICILCVLLSEPLDMGFIYFQF